MSKEIVSAGENFSIVKSDRAYNSGPQQNVLTADGVTGKLITGGTLANGVYEGGQGVTGGSTLLAGNSFVSAVVTGRATAGAITLAGALVGDVVLIANNMTTPATANSLFEATVSVAGQLQQTTAVDESASKFSILLAHQ